MGGDPLGLGQVDALLGVDLPARPRAEEVGGRVLDGIARERALMEPLRDAADWAVDTSDLPSPALRRLVERRFRPDGAPGLSVLVQSFAFPREGASVRQILGRPGEVWLPESGTEHISVIGTA